MSVWRSSDSETKWNETIHDIIGVAIVFYLTLIDSIDHFPPFIRDLFEHKFNILQTVSVGFSELSPSTYTVLKTGFGVVLLVWEEGTDPCPGPIEDRYDEWGLNLIAGVDEMSVVDGPKAGNAFFGAEHTYAVHRPSVFTCDTIASHPSESSEKAFREGIRKVRGNEFGLFIDGSIIDRYNRSKEVFDSRKVERW